MRFWCKLLDKHFVIIFVVCQLASFWLSLQKIWTIRSLCRPQLRLPPHVCFALCGLGLQLVRLSSLFCRADPVWLALLLLKVLDRAAKLPTRSNWFVRVSLSCLPCTPLLLHLPTRMHTGFDVRACRFICTAFCHCDVDFVRWSWERCGRLVGLRATRLDAEVAATRPLAPFLLVSGQARHALLMRVMCVYCLLLAFV